MTGHTYSAADLGAWYWHGVHQERQRIAAAWTELDGCWRPLGPQGHAERVQARRDLFRKCAVDAAEKAGRTYVDYRGGPVRWDPDTAAPLEQRQLAEVAA